MAMTFSSQGCRDAATDLKNSGEKIDKMSVRQRKEIEKKIFKIR